MKARAFSACALSLIINAKRRVSRFRAMQFVALPGFYRMQNGPWESVPSHGPFSSRLFRRLRQGHYHGALFFIRQSRYAKQAFNAFRRQINRILHAADIAPWQYLGLIVLIGL